MVQYGRAASLDRFVDVLLNDFGAVLMIEVPRHEAVHVHGRAVNRFAARYLFAGQQQEVLADRALELDRFGVDELVVLAQDSEVVAVVVIPLGDECRGRVCMPAKRGVGMGVALVPVLGVGKPRNEEGDGDKSNFHKISLCSCVISIWREELTSDSAQSRE